MSKKTTTKKANPIADKAMDEKVVIPQEVIESSIKIKSKEWEIKDRVYILSNGTSPLSYKIKGSNVYYFDEEKGYERELKCTSNQKTCFVDEMIGEQRLEHIIFRNGTLSVPRNKQVLQKLLSLYHPYKDKLYYEFDPVSVAVDEVSILELEIKALTTATSLDIDMAEAILRVELGSKVSSMSSKELKRDLLLFAKKNPSMFLELANDDNVQLRNIGIRATEMGVIKLSKDNRTFKWASNDRKLMTVPFDEHPYSALAAWFKTDEGMEVFSSIEKRLK